MLINSHSKSKNIYTQTKFISFFTILLFAFTSIQGNSQPIRSTPPRQSHTNTKKLCIEFKNVPFADAVNTLSIHQDKNIILTPLNKTPISLRLKNVSFEQALHLLSDIIDYEFIKNNNIYKIQPKNQQQTEPEEQLPFKINIDEGKLTLEAYEQEISFILKEVSKKSSLNFSFPHHLKGKVNISIRNIPLIPAINSILKQKNYQLKLQEGIYTMQKISPLQSISAVTIEENSISISAHNQSLKSILFELGTKTKTNIITLPSVSARVNANLRGPHLLPLLSSLLSGTGYQCFVSNDTFIIGSPFEIKAEHFPFLKTEVIQLKHIETTVIESKLPTLFPQENILIIKEQNSIAITGSEKLISSFKEYIRQVDIPIPQIKVDVLVVEYKDQFSQESGIDITTKGVITPFSILSLAPEGILQESGSRNPRTATFQYDQAFPIPTGLQVYIKSLVAQGKARIWANPSIWTLSGQEASINVVTEDRFRDERYNANTGRYESSGAPIIIDSGIKLKLKARVVNQHEIILEIEPEVSSATGTFSADSLPQTNTRSAKTIIKAKNNETIKLGGLIQTKTDTSNSHAPILSFIPIIGELLKGEKTVEHTSELVFYITPSIIDSDTPTLSPPLLPGPLTSSQTKPNTLKEPIQEKETEIEPAHANPLHELTPHTSPSSRLRSRRSNRQRTTPKRKKVRPQRKFQKKTLPAQPQPYSTFGFDEQ